MPRMIEIKPGNNLTIAGPANVRVWGAPTLSGTQPVPGDYSPESTDEHANHPESHKTNHHHKNSKK